MSSTAKVLIVDDEPDIVKLISYNLQKEGFEFAVAYDGEEAIRQVSIERPDLLILDLMLPKMSGMDICRRLKSDKAFQYMPIIMLTAKSDETDKIVGLEMGADDYMTKPFNVKELIARVRSVLRRTHKPPVESSVITIGGVAINKDACEVLKNGHRIDLSATEYRIILYLAECRGRVISRDKLLDAVWKNESYVEPRTVDVHVRRLRTLIEDDPAKPEIIKTKRGFGYYIGEAE